MASSRPPSTASVMAKTFLECIELSEGYTDYPIKPSSSSDDAAAAVAAATAGAAWHSPRISFSNEFAQISDDQQQHQQLQQMNSPTPSHKPSSSGEFEFNMAAPSMQSPLSADELFYKGKLLPLHLPPRIRMVQDLCEDYPSTTSKQQLLTRSPALAMMRRERSLRSPARPAFVPTTLKSSSYPPPGYSSRPTSPPKVTKCAGSSSRWRDLFGFKKPQANGKALPLSPASASSSSSSKQSSKFLKMIFNRGSTTTASSSAAASGNLDNSTGLGSFNYLHHHPEEIASNSDPLLPLLRDASESSTGDQMAHSCSTSSSSSSNWTASSASSSTASNSSFSAEFPDISSSSNPPSTTSMNHPTLARKVDKVGRNHPALTRSSARRRGIPPRNKPSGGANISQASTLSRSGSSRRPVSSTGSILGSSSRMQLQDHINSSSSNNNNNNNSSSSSSSSKISTRPHSDNWRRPENSKSASSSVRVTPVLHVPACIGPSSLRNVKVHGFRRLFSSSSTSGSSKPPHHPDNTVAVM